MGCPEWTCQVDRDASFPCPSLDEGLTLVVPSRLIEDKVCVGGESSSILLIVNNVMPCAH